MEYGSIDSDGEMKDNSTETRGGMMDTRDVCTGTVRIPSYKEIVSENLNSELSSSGGQAIGKTSEQSFSKLIKI